MSRALQLNPSIMRINDPAFLTATINGGTGPHLRIIKVPSPLNFNSTSTPSLTWKTYPQGELLVLSAGHTKNGTTVRFEIVFFVKPLTGQYPISGDSDRNALTYYSDPVAGTLHKGVEGTLNIEYDEINETLRGTFYGRFDQGGVEGADLFPINGEFLAYGGQSSKKSK
ncbi:MULTISPECIES: hypothetical protein [Pseudomonas]|uniref:Uncharacterized protein n=1 Tax=Pseudomonas koreensis TaxID=198620 RepID=A0AA94ESL3_9PSED|nr:hypothetical protein [Pseudomonas koreensis]RVD79716.1 hypothetical protein A9HBioS_0240 [Pseudomonas koreensis]